MAGYKTGTYPWLPKFSVPTKLFTVVDVHSVVRKCVLVNTGSDLFVSNIPNFVETD